MDGYFKQLPEKIQSHIKEVSKTVHLPEDENAIETLAQAWLEKKKMFEEQIHNLHMVEAPFMRKEDKRGALILTYSGSLISLGALTEQKRMVEYASIGLRKDVPEIAKKDAARLLTDLNTDQIVEFADGPIKKSSPILKTAVCTEEVSREEQEKRIREATIFLTNGFIKINRTVISPDASYPDQFTMKTITAYLASKNGISQKMTRQILEDYSSVIETGVLLGAHVPVGKIGKIFLKKRPAQKARVGRNPATGEEITIRAKPEIYIPKVSFSKHLKERAANTRIV
jgi:nucleoid DNA-binding protein